MTIAQAAELLGKSIDTIYRWKREGIDVHNEASLLKHCEKMALRSKGSSRNRVLANMDLGNPFSPTPSAPITLEQAEQFIEHISQPVPLTPDELTQCMEGTNLPQPPIRIEAIEIFFRLGQSMLRALDVRREQLAQLNDTKEVAAERAVLTNEREIITEALKTIGHCLDGYLDDGLEYALSSFDFSKVRSTSPTNQRRS